MNLILSHKPEKSSSSKANYLKPIEVSTIPRQVTKEFERDPELWFSMYPTGVKATLEVILEADNNLKYPTLLLKTIADRVGVSIRTVIQYIKILMRGGLIGKIQRHSGIRKSPRMRSSIFLVSDYFHNLCNRKRLCHLFKAFLYTPFILLAMSNGVCHKIGTSLQLEKVNDYVNIFSLYNSFIFSRTKISNSTAAQTKKEENKTMLPQTQRHHYPNMDKKAKKSWGEERPYGSVKQYRDDARPQCQGGSVDSGYYHKVNALAESTLAPCRERKEYLQNNKEDFDKGTEILDAFLRKL